MLRVRADQLVTLRKAMRPSAVTVALVEARLVALETGWTTGCPGPVRTARARQALGWALERGLCSEAALLCYAGLGLTFGPAFHHSPGVDRCFRETADADAVATQLPRTLSPADWRLIRRRAADAAQWTGEEDWSS